MKLKQNAGFHILGIEQIVVMIHQRTAEDDQKDECTDFTHKEDKVNHLIQSGIDKQAAIEQITKDDHVGEELRRENCRPKSIIATYLGALIGQLLVERAETTPQRGKVLFVPLPIVAQHSDELIHLTDQIALLDHDVLGSGVEVVKHEYNGYKGKFRNYDNSRVGEGVWKLMTLMYCQLD